MGDLFIDGVRKQIDDEFKKNISGTIDKFYDYEEYIYNNPTISNINNLSEYRTNIIQWYPFEKNDKILELNAEYGAITGGYLDKVARATVVTDDNFKGEIIRKRYKNYNNLNIIVNDYKKYIINCDKKYDYILYVGGALKLDELLSIKNLLSKNGKLLIATENRLGLKYVAGCRDEYTKGYYDSINNRDYENTFDLKKWKKNLYLAGYDDIVIRYPYPDYKFCQVIYSDEFLPDINQLNSNNKIFDEDRLLSFDETEIFNVLIEKKAFPIFSNSFFIETGKSCGMIYTKFSKERKYKYQIFTSIFEKDNKKLVYKNPAHIKAISQVKKMLDNYSILKNIFNKNEFHIADCYFENGKVKFEYISGKTLASFIDDHIVNNELEKLWNDLDILKNIIDHITLDEKFVPDNNFLTYFNGIVIPSNLKKSKVAFIDLNLDNIIINEKNKINIIDYEWVLPFSVPIEFIVFRILFLSYSISSLSLEFQKKVYKYLNVDYQLYNVFLEMELAFQRHVMSKKNNLCNIFDKMNIQQYDLRKINYHRLFYSPKILNADSGEILNYSTECNEMGIVEIHLDSSIKNIIFEPSQHSVFMQFPKVKAIKDKQIIDINEISHNAKLVEKMDLYFSDKPQIYIANDNYDKIIIQYIIYLWKPDLVKKMLEEKSEFKTIQEKLSQKEKELLIAEEKINSWEQRFFEFKNQYSMIYNIYIISKKIKKKLKRYFNGRV